MQDQTSLFGLIVAAASAVVYLRLRRSFLPKIKPHVSQTALLFLQQGRRRLLTRLLDVGGFFGLDIGGSLTKLVFFVPDDAMLMRMLKRAPATNEDTRTWAEKIFHIRETAKFVLGRDRYGATGVRDHQLSFHMAELGGSFHFLRYANIAHCAFLAQTYFTDAN
jgi:hypothetical protein